MLLADRPAVEAGRLDPARDRAEGPARHAVADRALLRADRKRWQAGGATPAPRRRAAVVERAARPGSADAAALAVVRQGLYEATHLSFGTSSAIFGSFPIPIAGKTGTAEKVVDPGDGYPRIFNQSWWCGYGPADSPTLVVCALIENGGHGGTAAAPGALKVFEQFFGKEATQMGPVHSD